MSIKKRMKMFLNRRNFENFKFIYDSFLRWLDKGKKENTKILVVSHHIGKYLISGNTEIFMVFNILEYELINE